MISCLDQRHRVAWSVAEGTSSTERHERMADVTTAGRNPDESDGPGSTTTGDESAVTFGILGPLEVRGHSGPVTLRGVRQRVALTALLLRANTVVPLDDIIDYIWPDRAPATAREQVLIIVSGLRRVLGGAEQRAETRLVVTCRPGYLIRIHPGQLDAQRFETLVLDGERELAAGRAAQAAAAFRTALALWRGRALADVCVPFAANEAQRLAELKLKAAEKLVDVEFGLGRHRDVLPQLAWLVAEHPLQERLRGQLMVALHEVGRTAEALKTYRAGRQLMVEELGLEPGAELRRIEHAILLDAGSGGPDTARRSVGPAVSAGRPVFAQGPPAHLPPDITDFVSRHEEIDDICRHVRTRDDHSRDSAVPIVAIGGQAGVGKSALAVRVGHLLRDIFPDGQLYVSLRGTQTHPRDPFEALVSMIAALGTPAGMIPDDLDEQVRLYRTLTAGRRSLVVLDDAADAAQVRPLLPSGHRCAVVVTSRWHLADLAGAHHLRLDVLPEEDAMALLAATAGKERVAGARPAAHHIVDLCGRLPLALRIAGTKVASRPHWSLSHMAERLVDQRRRLDELRVGDLEVRASLALSFRRLDPALDAAAKRLGLLEAPTFTTRAAAAVLDLPVTATEDLIDQLVEWQILQYAGRDDEDQPRFLFPDLLRLYLRERAHAAEQERVAGSP
jgi:DNA-binding SARP family transcriptional activator